MNYSKLHKGMAELVVILIILAGVAAVVYIVAKPAFMNSDAARRLNNSNNSVSGTPSVEPTEIPPFNNKADLEASLEEIDNENVDGVLQEVNKNDSEVNNL